MKLFSKEGWGKVAAASPKWFGQKKQPAGRPPRPGTFGDGAGARRYALWSCVLLCAIGVLIYSNTFSSSLHFDDYPCLKFNRTIRHLFEWHNIWQYWPTRFITFLSFAVNFHFHRFRVFGYHVVNLLIHLGSGILVWRFVFLTFSTPAVRCEDISRHAKPLSLFAGLVFITHPIQTQAVTYISQRAASLATFFYMASLLLYVSSGLSRDAGHRGTGRYIASLVMAVLAMFAKEITITLPLAICLYEFCFFRKEKAFQWGRVLPFLFCLLIIPLTALLTHFLNLVEMRRWGEAGFQGTAASYLLTQLRVTVTYVRLLFFPVRQNVDYDYPIAVSLFRPPIFGSLLLIIALIVTAARIFRKHRLISFGTYWFFLTLAPESGLIPIRDVIFEHRLYLPMVGFCFILTGGLYHFFGRENFKRVIAPLVFVPLCFSILSYARNFVWKDELTLWSDAAAKSPNKARTCHNRDLAYSKFLVEKK
ncbi:MAG: hypothetical protein ACM3L6_03795 [Deltaproteobacteria bacterium]